MPGFHNLHSKIRKLWEKPKHCFYDFLFSSDNTIAGTSFRWLKRKLSTNFLNMINFTPKTLAKCSLCTATKAWLMQERNTPLGSVLYCKIWWKTRWCLFRSRCFLSLEIFCYLEGKYEENFIVRTKNNVGRFIFYPIVVLQRRNSFFDVNFNKMYVLFPHTKPFLICYQFLCRFSLFWAQVRFI